MSTNTTPIAQLPKLTREFPAPIEFLLPLRHSARCYDEDGGSVPIAAVSPETDVNENSSGEMYAMTMQVPICGHATMMKHDEKSVGFVSVCEPTYVHSNVEIMKIGIQTV